MIKIKRVYETADPEDGYRILIDRLWPRGVAKNENKWDEWMKEIAPSTDLRKWYDHDTSKWNEFKKRYTDELHKSKDKLDYLMQLEKKHGTLTLLYAAKYTQHANATILLDVLNNLKNKQ